MKRWLIRLIAKKKKKEKRKPRTTVSKYLKTDAEGCENKHNLVFP